MHERKHTWKTLLHGIIWIAIALIIFGILNLVANYVREANFHLIVSFLNHNLLLIILISLITLFGDVFEDLNFPFNIFYPFARAVASVIIVIFVFRTIEFVDMVGGTGIYELAYNFYYLALIIIPFIVLVVGFSSLIIHYWPKRRVDKGKPKKSPRKK